MKNFILTFFTLALSLMSLTGKPAIDPSSVAILYNSNAPESKELADYYAKARNIPAENLIGLATSNQGKISRAEYIKTIQTPLRKHFTEKQWWSQQLLPEGFKVSTSNRIKLLVCMRGIPYGINQDASIKVPANVKANPAFTKYNCASVDSELAALSFEGYPTYLPLQNKYYNKDDSFNQANLPFYMLVGRIDDHKLETCKRMIDDAIAVEKTGLFGMCYLDQAKKGKGYVLGDKWIQNIEKKCWEEGIPATMDENKDTYLTNYPMRDVALYFGWYITNRNGPFLNPQFRLKKGSVAVHLHSFSASSLRNPNSNWTGPIINAGAAATVGNVYEPYLGFTHHLDIFQDRLLKGYSLVEAASMSMPILSWQSVVIGDPLYQPYKNIHSKDPKPKSDKFYQAVRIGLKAWHEDSDLLSRKFRTAAQKTKDARYYEVIGLFKRFQSDNQTAKLFFSSAEKMYLSDHDKTRMKLHLIDMLREEKNKQQAIFTARILREEIKGTPEEQTVQSILNILSPPAPPKATPKRETKK